MTRRTTRPKAEEFGDCRPDVSQLFAYFDRLYFGGELGSCSSVHWTSRRSLGLGTSSVAAGDSFQIYLSEPNLKSRNKEDIKSALLHHMIHVFLLLRDKDHSDHGDDFLVKAIEISESQAVDDERPRGGYKIASIEPQRWKCQSCGDGIDLEADNEPGCSIGEPCLQQSCHWHMHNFKCSGEYTIEGISCIRHQEANKQTALKRKVPVEVVILEEPSPRRITRKRRIDSFFRNTAVPEAKRQRCGVAAEDLDATVIIGWKGWWAVEREEEDPDVRRLIDRRRQRESVMQLCAKVEEPRHAAKALENETQEMALVMYEAEEQKVNWFEPAPLARKEQEAGTSSPSSKRAEPLVLKCFSRRRKQKRPISSPVKQEITEEDKIQATDGELIEGSVPVTNAEPLLLAAVPMTTCPICDKMFVCDPDNPQDNAVFNTHVDSCLNSGFN